MTGWSFDPVGSWWLVLAAALALAPLLALGPRQHKQSFRRRVVLTTLRLGTLVLLLWFMMRPALETRTTRKMPGTLVVLADASRSMTVKDATGNVPRYTAMQESLDGAWKQLDELSHTWAIHSYSFGRDTKPPNF